MFQVELYWKQVTAKYLTCSVSVAGKLLHYLLWLQSNRNLHLLLGNISICGLEGIHKELTN